MQGGQQIPEVPNSGNVAPLEKPKKKKCSCRLHLVPLLCTLFATYVTVDYFSNIFFENFYETSLRINAMAPVERGCSWTRDLPYCKTKLHPNSSSGFEIYPCKYFDSASSVFPQGMDSSISITTRITSKAQRASSYELDTPDTMWKTDKTDTFYLADIENFVIHVDQSLTSPLNFSRRFNNREGKIANRYGEEIKEHENETIGVENEADRIFVSTLLQAAGVDIDKDSFNGKDPVRYTGAVFMVFLEYHNSPAFFWEWGNDDMNYTIKVVLMDTEYKTEQTVYTKPFYNRVVNERYGLHFIFVPSFNFMHLVSFSIFFLLVILEMVGLLCTSFCWQGLC